MRGKRSKQVAQRFVVCIDNSDYEASLERHKIYSVLPDADAARDGDLRIIDERGEDYLFGNDRFIEIEVPETLERAMLKMASGPRSWSDSGFCQLTLRVETNY